uniref:Uncharacterized protein n=1 Tax=Toxoplasma gondii (strain ATCC 50861 / VEG) TaxID=432359 RepID=A0A0F7UYF2_TOXGV|nr:TPA: hypothetical protein BN1205_048895 [Toxoplasma gondii VEG]
MYMASAEAIAEKDKLIETLKSDISFTRMQEMKAELDAYADECSRLSMEVKRLSNHQPQPRVHELEEQSVAYFLDKKVKAAQKQERQSMQSFMSRPQSVNEGVAGRARETDKEFPVEKERHSAPLQIDVETENSEAHEQADVCASN